MTAPAQAADASTAWHALSIEDALAGQQVDPAKGLSAAEVEARRAKYGANRFAEQKTEPRWRAFLRQYKDAMQIVLLVAGLLSIYPVNQVSTGVMLILLTVFNAYLGLSQEGKAAAAVAALQKMMIVKSRVRRDGELAEVAAEELVPGDIVSFEAGDLDLRPMAGSSPRRRSRSTRPPSRVRACRRRSRSMPSPRMHRWATTTTWRS